MFFEATAVLMAEIFKLVTCLFLVFNDEGRDTTKYFKSLYQTIWVNKFDTLKVSIDCRMQTLKGKHSWQGLSSRLFYEP